MESNTKPQRHRKWRGPVPALFAHSGQLYVGVPIEAEDLNCQAVVVPGGAQLRAMRIDDGQSSTGKESGQPENPNCRR